MMVAVRKAGPDVCLEARGWRGPTSVAGVVIDAAKPVEQQIDKLWEDVLGCGGNAGSLSSFRARCIEALA